jgi:hypothetical protein
MRHADRPSTEVELYIEARSERLWPLISDIAVVVECSDELQSVAWASGEGDEPAVGRTFVGTSGNKYFGEWQTTSTVTECDPPRTFGWVVGDLDEPNSSWRFTLRPSGTGTVVTQWARLGYGPSGMHLGIKANPDKEERIVANRLEQWRTAMRATLELIKQRAESS